MDREQSDQYLIAAYLSGDQKSLEFLIGRYLRPVYSFVYRYVGRPQEAEDITQEVFVRAWRSLKKFDQSKSFKTWVFTIAKNASLDFLKKKKTVLFSELENRESGTRFEEKLADSSPLPPELLEERDKVQELNAALSKLALSDRLLLFLRYNDHFTFREAAEALGEPLNTVKSRHRRAIFRLKRFLEKKP